MTKTPISRRAIDIPEEIDKKELEEEEEYEEYSLRKLDEEYSKLERSPWYDKLEFLYESDAHEVSKGWLEEELEVLTQEAEKNIERELIEGLGDDAKYMDDVAPINEFAKDTADALVWSDPEIALNTKKRDEYLQSRLNTLYERYGKALEELKKEEREAEQLRDTVRYMQTPREQEQIEFTTEPHELEQMQAEPLGAVSTKITQRRTDGMLGKLFKVAYSLDRKGLYDEAAAIDKVMQSLAKRTGLKPKDIASIANFLDEQGDTALASKFDNMLKSATKKTI